VAKAKAAWSREISSCTQELAVPEESKAARASRVSTSTSATHLTSATGAGMVRVMTSLARQASKGKIQRSAAMNLNARKTKRIGGANKAPRTTTVDQGGIKPDIDWEEEWEDASFVQAFQLVMYFVVCSLAFDYFSALMILLNGVFLGVQTHYSAVMVTEDMPLGFRELDVVFCIVFSLELCARLFVFGLHFFSMSTWRWNLLDFMLVTVQIIEEMIMAVASVSLGVLKFMRFLRLLRIMRMLRVLRFIGDLRTILFTMLI
jgi:hypothetical protein